MPQSRSSLALRSFLWRLVRCFQHPGLVWLALAPAVLLVSSPAIARDGENEVRLNACFDSFEQSQVLLRDGKLTEARQAAEDCTSRCPEEIIAECEALVSDVSRDVPTALVLAVTERGTDATGVEVEVDGQLRDDAAGGEMDLDPGKHSIRFFREEDGWEEVVDVVMRRGEKRRQIRVVVPRLKDASSAGASASGRPRRTSAVMPWVVTSYAVGAVGFGLAAAGGIVSLTDQSSLDDCRPSCSPEYARQLEKRSNTWLTIADIGLGVGAVGLVTGTALLIWGPKKKVTSSTVNWTLLPTRGGAAALLSHSF